jgi:hypothetical protein
MGIVCIGIVKNCYWCSKISKQSKPIAKSSAKLTDAAIFSPEPLSLHALNDILITLWPLDMAVMTCSISQLWTVGDPLADPVSVHCVWLATNGFLVISCLVI